MLPVGSRKCCTYVLYIYYSSGTPERNTWRKTHTFHQVPTRPAALMSFTGGPAHFCLVFSLSFPHSFSYRSRNMFHHSLPDRIYSSSTRRVCAYICIKHLAKNMVDMVSDAQHAKLFTSAALYKLMIILSLSVCVPQ
jgi:hypothetical protein